jgi:hypothetical protein
MGSLSRLLLVAACAGLLPAGARAAEPSEPLEVRAERDQLLERIAQGVDYEASVRRFKELWDQRQAQREAQKREAEARSELQKKLSADTLTLDHRVAEQCIVSVDPAAPPRGVIWELYRGDFGKIVRKETIQLPPRTAFVQPETVSIYQLEGRQHRYVFSSKEMHSFDRTPLDYSVGDTVLLCRGGMATHGSGGYYPEGLRDNVVSSGFAARLKQPPKLVEKKRLDPVHLLGTARLRMAISRTDWPVPPEQPVLTRLLVERDLGNGRFELRVEPGRRDQAPLTLFIDVPAALPRRKLIEPGRILWFIVSAPRFDPQLQKLILRAEDVEERMFEPG